MPETDAQVRAFVERWSASGGAERSNYQLFLVELCDAIDLPHPDPAKPENERNAYVFERAVTFQHGDGTSTTKFVDLYRRGSFVLEAKQGVEQETESERASLTPRDRPSPRRRGVGVRGTEGWDSAMVRARHQAERYVRALPGDEGRPPFILVVDVGHVIEVYAEFTRTGGMYVPFPDPLSHRIALGDLPNTNVRELLRLIWTDPMALDPSRRSARVTREVAERLARVARSLEASGHKPDQVAPFLMRCIFTMFAEDIRLVPEGAFRGLLDGLREQPEAFVPMLEELWQAMKLGAFSTALRAKVRHFNGHLFEDTAALPVTQDQLALLIEAARADWRDVEPAVFGTLLERALDPAERHKLGAHFTPRAYVERLVLPTVIVPLREEWAAVQTAAMTHLRQGQADRARAELDAFHARLCKVTVLDPACGSGNFLYVTLEHLKRLEGEVLDALESLGEQQGHLETLGLTVDPHQFYGLEINPRAVAIADLVLWIGYLQWHVRTRGDVSPPEPVIRNVRNMFQRDAVLQWDREVPVRDADGNPVTRWDGRTTKPHPATGEPVPDEYARVPVMNYVNPRPAYWPPADFVVGNPPYIGNWRMRTELGDGYTEAIRAAHPDLPETCDYVMYWWDRAAQLVREGKVKRFGLITTNSLRQTFNRRVVERRLKAKDRISLLFAIPDHPWVDAADGAAVRVSLTVGGPGEHPGRLLTVVDEEPSGELERTVTLVERVGLIHPDLTIGPPVADAVRMKANGGLSCRGVSLHGAGFIVTPEEAKRLGLGRIPGLENHIRPYRNGRDIAGAPRGVLVIDLFGLSETEVRSRFPEVYQRIVDRVKPERDHNRRASYRDNWWIFGEARSEFRPALKGLARYVATVETSKHRFFVFLDASILPDNKLVNIASDDAYLLGVLSSRIHVVWALAQGSTLEDRPVYVKTTCFEAFPFPEFAAEQKERIRALGEALDAHRKRQQDLHPGLTLTGVYNVLTKVRLGEPLTERERDLHEQGLVAVLREIHDELDQAVAAAYGWPVGLADEEILARLVALNARRAAEEEQGLVRWLRPELQAPRTEVQVAIPVEAKAERKRRPGKRPWPRLLPEQVQAIRAVLADLPAPATAGEVAKSFQAARSERVAEILETLVALGQAESVGAEQYIAG